MFKPLVNFLLRKKLSDSERAPSMVSGRHVMHVAVVACRHDEKAYAGARAFVNELRKRGLRTVDFFIAFPSKKSMQNFEASANDVAFRSSDFNWIGKVLSDKLKLCLKKDYEVLIDLSRGNSFAADVLISKLSAKWKAGEFNEKRAHLLDLMIDVKADKDITKLIHHIDHYILNLNNSNAA